MASEPYTGLLVSTPQHWDYKGMLAYPAVWASICYVGCVCVPCRPENGIGSERLNIVYPASEQLSPSGPQHRVLPSGDSAAVLLMDKLRDCSSAPPSARSEWMGRLLGLQHFPYTCTPSLPLGYFVLLCLPWCLPPCLSPGLPLCTLSYPALGKYLRVNSG